MSAPSTSILSVITVTSYPRKIWLLYLLPSMNLAVMTLSEIWFNCLFKSFCPQFRNCKFGGILVWFSFAFITIALQWLKQCLGKGY